MVNHGAYANIPATIHSQHHQVDHSRHPGLFTIIPLVE